MYDIPFNIVVLLSTKTFFVKEKKKIWNEVNYEY